MLGKKKKNGLKFQIKENYPKEANISRYASGRKKNHVCMDMSQ